MTSIALIYDDRDLPIFGGPDTLPILYPTWWARKLTHEGQTWSWQTGRGRASERSRALTRESGTPLEEIVRRPASESTVRTYIEAMRVFLNWLVEESPDDVAAWHHSGLCEKNGILAKYITHLTNTRMSAASVQKDIAALNSYYLWLYSVDLASSAFRLELSGKQIRTLNAKKSASNTELQYVDEGTYQNMLLHLGERDQLVFECGYRLGCRTADLQGFYLQSKSPLNNRNKKPTPGLLDLFEEAKRNPKQMIFNFWLMNSKGAKSRYLYISRELLERMEKYYNGTRKKIVKECGNDEDCLFITDSINAKGQKIVESHGSNTFKICKRSAGMDDCGLTFHSLRHSFATDQYHSQFERHGNQKNALLHVAELLGHASTSTTEIYVHMCYKVYGK